MQENKAKEKIKTVTSKVLDVPILFFCLFAVAVLLYVTYHSMFALIDLVSLAANIRSKMMFIGILLAVLWSIMGFVEGFINTFAKTYRHLFNKQKEVNN